MAFEADAPQPECSTSLDAKLRFLCSPDAHGGQAGMRIELIETHMSWLVLGPDRVLKLKKPIRRPFLDFTTLAAREWNAREELRLNRRLAAPIYRGLVVLVKRDGRMRLVAEHGRQAHDETLDWLVAMRRVPREQLADHMLRAGTATPQQLDRLAALLLAFYADAAVSTATPDEYVARFEHEQALNRELLLRGEPLAPAGALPYARATVERYDAALRRRAHLLRDRVREHRIVDGHGDLRPEHVGFVETPVVIDALEFNAAMRQVDPLDELAYFALECRMLGAGWAGERVLARAIAAWGAPPPGLVELYGAFRALLRARLSLAHLLDPTPRDPARWVPQARLYLDEASAALDAIDAIDRPEPPAG